MRVWDSNTGRQSSTSPLKYSDKFKMVAGTYSLDGRWIVAGADDGIAFVWDAATGALRYHLRRGDKKTIVSLAVSPDGRRAAVGASDGTLRVWNLENGELVREFVAIAGHGENVAIARSKLSMLSFSADSNLLVSASADSDVRIYDANDGAFRCVLKGHSDEVMTAYFSPDGTRIVTASLDKRAAIWTLSECNGGVLDRSSWLGGHSKEVRHASYSPDGRWILTSSQDGAVRVWEAGEGVKKWVPRCFKWVA